MNSEHKKSQCNFCYIGIFGRGRRFRTLGTRFWRPLLELTYTIIKGVYIW